MNNLFIHCDGGFGNRFNVFIFGLYLSKKLKYNLKIHWPCNNWCGADFEDIFDMPESKFLISSVDFSSTVNIMHENQLKVKNYINIHHIQSLEQLYKLCEKKDIFYFNNLIPWNLVSDEAIFLSCLKSLKFQNSILNRVSAVLHENSIVHPFYGIHLRKTDFGNRSDFVETDLLKIVKLNADKKFFICSDDPKTEKKFLEQPNVFYNNKESYVKKLVDGGWNQMITDSNNNSFNFNVDRPKNSVVEAMVDLLLLSRSTIISPDIGSTFCQTAKLIGRFL